MVNPGDLVNALVTKMQLVEGLVREVGSDPQKIYVYQHNFPRTMTLEDAVYQMPPGSMMVAWEGTGPGRLDRMEVWKFRLGIYVKPAERPNIDAAYSVYQLWDNFINGVPVGEGCDGQKMLRTEIHDDFWPMDTPSITAQSGRTPESGATFEYFKISVTFTQKGD
jgi:hypothetical protein